MSGIYYPKSEHFETCVNCPARHGAECWASHCARIPDYHKSRPEWCPAIPVPDHGRLIDADALIKSLSLDEDDAKDGASLLMAIFLEVLKAAPTIIEAELPVHHGTFAATSKEEALKKLSY